ncbi:GNAT family N-acetyltransferase [Deinococcus sp.]|uniref:GNAT family N-acetyltransferase n=1 Tax=Deinococcus sp. TaxID=47478 RepID=UPI003B5CC8E7
MASAISDDGMVYLLLGERAAVCLYADTPHRYGFLDFPYAVPEDADALLKAVLSALIGLRVECPLPSERVWEAEALLRHGFQVGRTQRRMVRDDLNAVAASILPAGTKRIDPSPDELEALHNLVFTGHSKPAGWRTDPDHLPPLGLNLGGQLAGYALSAHHGGLFWLSELAVHPDFRRQGLGRALTRLTLAQLRGAGASQVHLYVNDDHGQHAPRLYEGAGFKTHRLTLRYVKEN